VGITYSADDYLAAMRSRGHRGRAWTTEPGTVRSAVMIGLAQSYVRSGARAVNLIDDASPATTSELLPEWEKSLGLPDPCTPLNPSTAQRKAAVLAKFIAAGGQSPSYFIAVAAALGYPITITELPTPYHWQINAPTLQVSYFTAGVSVAGDPLWTIGNLELECRIRSIMPAHTVLTFDYGSGLLDDGGVLILATPPAGYPTSMSGLSPGALWSNGGVVSVVTGTTPNPLAPPVIYSNTTAAALLALGGANLPLTAPPLNSSQIWNSGGELWIA
jgi:uncharacterized protein YmfQ (DUF2313 family)